MIDFLTQLSNGPLTGIQAQPQSNQRFANGDEANRAMNAADLEAQRRMQQLMMTQPRSQSRLQMAPPNAPRRGAAWSGIQMATSLDETLQGNPDFSLQGGDVNPGYIPLQNSGRGGRNNLGYGANLQPTHNPQDPMAILRSLLGL